MPCNDGPWDRAYDTSVLKNRNDTLAAENCLLRETIIKLATAPPGSPVEIDKKIMKLIQKSQADHRKDDLARLEKTVRSLITADPDIPEYYDMLGRIVMADPKQPLEPQLGFDPDAY